jgi:hypothetical protein
VLEVIAGYDPQDELTAFSIGRLPPEPYRSFANERTLNGFRIGVIREHMDKRLLTGSHVETIDIVERGINDLRRLGATIVDPGPGGAWFRVASTSVFHSIQSGSSETVNGPHPAAGRYVFNPSLVPAGTTIRNIAGASDAGMTKYMLTRHLREPGDANIKSLGDLINKSSILGAMTRA